MSYAVTVPMGGHAGWAFLQRTRDQQQAAHAAAPAQQRLTDYFAEKIGQIDSAEALVEDRRLRQVALGAFGLDDDMDSRAFVLEVLKSNTYEPTSLASKLSDKRYLTMARSFGFGDIGGARTGDAGFARRITEAYADRQFEVSVGAADADLRLALGLERELDLVMNREMSDDARWYTVMATPPLRRVFETALGLPESFGALDIDRQLVEFRSRAEARFGAPEVSAFADPALRSDLVSKFLTGAEVQSLTASIAGSNQIALALLSPL
jgi:hypothetical protein